MEIEKVFIMKLMRVDYVCHEEEIKSFAKLNVGRASFER